MSNKSVPHQKKIDRVRVEDVIIPTEEEEAEIIKAALADPDNPPLFDAFLDRMQRRRGRPMIPAKARKKRINLMLDPDVVEKLKATGNMSNHTNKVLRDFFGL